jgi:hypothetical protein
MTERSGGVVELVRRARRRLLPWRSCSYTLPAIRLRGRGCGAWKRRLSTTVSSGGQADLVRRARRTLPPRRPCSYTLPAARPRGRRRGAWQRRRTTVELDGDLTSLVRGVRRGLLPWRPRSCTLPASRPRGRGCGAWRRRLSTMESSGGPTSADFRATAAVLETLTSTMRLATHGRECRRDHNARRVRPRGAEERVNRGQVIFYSPSKLEVMLLPAALRLVLGGAVRSSEALAQELKDSFNIIGDVVSCLWFPVTASRITIVPN